MLTHHGYKWSRWNGPEDDTLVVIFIIPRQQLVAEPGLEPRALDSARSWSRDLKQGSEPQGFHLQNGALACLSLSFAVG